MSRSPLSRGCLAALLFTVAFSGMAAAQDGPPIQRLDDSGRMAAPDSPPCGLGTRLPPGAFQRESTRPGATIDACGVLHLEPGGTLSSLSPPLLDAAAAVNARIDSMMVYATIFGYSASYFPGGYFQLVAHAERYYLDNGANWQSGAGTLYPSRVTFNRVEVSGDTLRYFLDPPPDGMLYRQTDFDAGDHSAQGEIAVEGPLVIVALAGASDGILMGQGRLVSNTATWYGEPRFNYYAAPIGSLLPFRMRYQLDAGGTYTRDLFTGAFYYHGIGTVDFAHATRPPLAGLQINGPSRIPDQATVPFAAVARYQSGALANVSGEAEWSVSPSALATVNAGALTVGAIAGEQAFTLHASYGEAGIQVEDDAQVVARHDFFASDHTSWPMYQADSRHTGALPVTPSVARFHLLWQRNLGLSLNPVAAGDGRVFCTGVTYFATNSPLYALDAATGATLWSTNFPNVFSVNPPSYAYGNVYVQTGDHAADTWLHAFDGATGERLFKSPHEAQWERYFAPTIQDGKVYVNGGYYGGMYAFDALTGGQLWFRDLPQYDEWTPAIGGDYAYAYVGSYSPGLYAVRRSDGQLVFMIPDPQFAWNGWSMNLAPVVGDHDDVLAIHDGRLISFDTAGRRIRWQLAGQYSGQPSVAGDVIYAIAGGALVALDERTGARIWSWAPPAAALQGSIVLTASIAFVSSASSVHAVSLDGRNELWSYPAAGSLAIANGALYVASSAGTLSAFEIGIGPPLVAHAGPDVTAECAAAAGGTHVTLDGSASEGPDLTFQWTSPGVTFDDAHSVTPVGTFPLGVNPVVLTVSRDGNIDRDTVVVTVVDTTPPTLGLAFQPPLLWPPDNRLVHVHVVATPADACDSAPAVTLRSVTSSEPDGGPNDPFPDDVLDAAYGQPDYDVWLRAQRSPNGDGRAYTFCYRVEDGTGHLVDQCASIPVPQARGRARLEEGGTPRLTILGESAVLVGRIDEGSIAACTWDADVWHVVAGSGVDSDVDGDGLVDRTWALARVDGATATTAPGGAALYARWRAGEQGFYAMLSNGGVTAVDTAPGALAVELAANPARDRALLSYVLPAAGHVRLTIYDVSGRVVATLVDAWAEAGRHDATFEPGDKGTSLLLYYRLEWNGQRRGGRFALLR